ncbi:hypothetical protein CMT25_01110 [Elizabethkingia anophelis]|uniref:Uncharacterized protein n=1 Tax=Elizabethkingia anophelis TaxID=1117645 RepID=A0AAE4P2K5_9FLAO|nr:hypothetical protein [Elizabethkingia anophelis]MDV3664940.1 hypothetical protein [Elizabethkingia anophelis]MDV4128742.1 hypothetical protein [Elizabethkingia anophelis]MDV4134802.1 hypothetical protein [Elizabethkingia anophelis]OPC62774.1 hypothetical protein BAY08_10425 [Elizabethkingia anophelis]
MDYKVYKKGDLWGLDTHGVEAVPFVHLCKSSAIGELIHFLLWNYVRPEHLKFLSDNRTLEEINKLEIDLFNQVNETPEYI